MKPTEFYHQERQGLKKIGTDRTLRTLSISYSVTTPEERTAASVCNRTRLARGERNATAPWAYYCRRNVTLEFALSSKTQGRGRGPKINRFAAVVNEFREHVLKELELIDSAK